jgi:hypothetical protein
MMISINKPMKALTFLLLSMACVHFTSCQKEDSVIEGRVSYIGAISGIEYLAPNARVNLYLGSISGKPSFSEVADANGEFRFDNLWDAEWYITSEYTVNGINYTGQAQTSKVNGENIVTLNLILQ